MTLTKDRESGVYKARVKTAGGRTVTLTTKATSKQEAKEIIKNSKLPQIERLAKAGALTAEALMRVLADRKVTMQSGIDSYIEFMKRSGRAPTTMHSVRTIMERFAKMLHLESKPIPACEDKHIYDYINGHGDSSAGWRKNQLSVLRNFFEFCQAKGWIVANPARLVRVRLDLLTHAQKETRELKTFTDEELDKLIAACDPGSFWHAAITISRRTGLRLGDIAKLEWDSFSIPDKIVVWTDKRDKRVALPLHPDIKEAIGAVPPLNPRRVFPEAAKIVEDPKRRANLSTSFRRLCDSVEVHGKTFHGIRATYISNCVKAGQTLEHIAKSVGHSETRTTEGYVKL